MSLFKRKTWARTKPYLGANINFGNPLTQNLKIAYPFNQSGGLIIRNSLSSYYNALASVAAYFTWKSTKFGKGLLCSNNIDAQLITLNHPFVTGTTFTIAGEIVLTSVLNTTQYAAIIVEGSSTNGLYLVGNLGFSYYLAGDNVGIPLATTPGGIRHSFLISVLNGVGTFYYKGVKTGTVSGITSLAFDKMANEPVGSSTLLGTYNYLYLWKRPLTATEAIAIYTRPYSIYTTPREYRIYPAASAYLGPEAIGYAE